MVKLELWQVSLLVFPALILFHLHVSPYTKVEESFNIQATHDILTYGLPTSNVALKLKAQYDHMTFPGAVPRTFIGAVVLAGIAKPITWAWEGVDQQQLVRAILGLFNAVALVSYASGVRRAFGKTTAIWYTAFQASQFHIIYYSSRTLPNMFAFGISTLALRCFLPDPAMSMNKIRQTRLAVYLLTLATVIFRSELALLLASHCLYLLAKAPSTDARLALIRTTFLPAGLSGGIAGLLLTISVDTFLWQSQTPLWPELTAFLANVFPSADSIGAAAWGTSPWHWYFTSALPRLFINPLVPVLIPYAFAHPATRSPALDLLIPNLAYIALYSILPHKETRFLFPILPPLTLAAALVASRLPTFSRRIRSSCLTTTPLVLTTLLTFVLSHFVLAPLSSLNYPGATALNRLHELTQNTAHRHLTVHLDTLTLQTGVTRFLQLPPPTSPLVIFPGSADGSRPTLRSGGTLWTYDKTENQTELLDAAFWQKFDYVIAEAPGRCIGAWEVVEAVYGLGRARVLGPGEERALRVLGNRGRWRGMDWEVHGRYGYGVGEWVLWGFDVVHDVLREGYGVGASLSQGWWVDVPMVEKLYVLKSAESGIGIRG